MRLLFLGAALLLLLVAIGAAAGLVSLVWIAVPITVIATLSSLSRSSLS